MGGSTTLNMHPQLSSRIPRLNGALALARCQLHPPFWAPGLYGIATWTRYRERAREGANPKKERREPMIVTFAADGRRLRDHSIAAIQHLLSVHAIVLDVRPDGKINYAQF